MRAGRVCKRFSEVRVHTLACDQPGPEPALASNCVMSEQGPRRPLRGHHGRKVRIESEHCIGDLVGGGEGNCASFFRGVDPSGYVNRAAECRSDCRRQLRSRSHQLHRVADAPVCYSCCPLGANKAMLTSAPPGALDAPERERPPIKGANILKCRETATSMR